MFQDPRKFLVTSDHPMDIVVWKGTGEMSIGPHDLKQVSIAHGLPFAPLVFGQVSFDDGQSWSPFATHYSQLTMEFSSDPTNVNIYALSFETGADMKFRFWGYAPADASYDILPPSSETRFNINTDYGYSQLIKAGKWDIEAGSRKVIFEHNLGFTPQVECWVEFDDGEIWGGELAGTYSTDTSREDNEYIEVDENKLYGNYTSLQYGSSAFKCVHYRIYGHRIGGDEW